MLNYGNAASIVRRWIQRGSSHESMKVLLDVVVEFSPDRDTCVNNFLLIERALMVNQKASGRDLSQVLEYIRNDIERFEQQED